jgi:hypothetical protein
MSAGLYSLEMGSSNYFPFYAQWTRPVKAVSLKSEKFEMDLGRRAPASEVAEGHTLPF